MRTRAWAAAGTAVLLAVGTVLPVSPALPTSRMAAASEAPEAPEAVLAQTFTAAWNAGDADGVADLFATGAQVRQANARVVQHGGNVDIDDVYGSVLTYEGAPPRFDGDEVVWATGEAEIRTWLTAILPSRQSVHATNPRVTGTVPGSGAGSVTSTSVGWDYRVPVPLDVQWAVPGLPPTGGTVAAQVTDGRITLLVLSSTPGAAARRERALAQALAALYTDADARAPAGDQDTVTHPPNPNTQARTTPSPAPGVLTLVGLAAAACLAVRTKR